MNISNHINKNLESLELKKSEKVSSVFVILASIYISAYVVSNVIASKNVILFDWSICGNSLSIASSFIVFPITYVLSDVFSEVYGYAWSRKVSWIAFLVNLFMAGLISLAVILPGTDPDFDSSFKAVLGSSFKIVMASQLAFMAGDFFNDRIFRNLKNEDRINNDFTFLFRSILSSLAGEILDSLIFLPLLYLAIGGFGTIVKSFWHLAYIVFFQGVVKTAMEIIGAPFEVAFVKSVKKSESKV